MSISLGNTGIKPYVGSKEVQEAYVGSTLVYSAGPGSNYAFLGTADGYYLASWVDIGNCTIEQSGGVYKIKMKRGNVITLNKSNISNFSKINLNARPGSNTTGFKVTFQPSATVYNPTIVASGSNVSTDIPSGTSSIEISFSAFGDCALNNIYLE